MKLLNIRPPAFFRAIRKGINGITALLIGAILDNWYYQGNSTDARNSPVNELVKSAGTALLFDALQECFQVMLYEAVKWKVKKNDRYAEILKKQKLAKHLLNISTSAYASVRTIQGLKTQIEVNVSPFAFAFPVGSQIMGNAGVFFNYINVPITNTLIMVMMIPTFFYNTIEFIRTTQSRKLRRDDPPIVQLLNALSYINTTAGLSKFLINPNNPYHRDFPKVSVALPRNQEALAQFYETAKIINDLREKYSFSSLVVPIIIGNYIGRFEAYKGIVQIVLNTQELLLDRITIEIQSAKQPKPPAQSSPKPNQPLLFQAGRVKAVTPAPLSVPTTVFAQTQKTSEITEIDPPVNPDKVKTRGIPYKNGRPSPSVDPSIQAASTAGSVNSSESKETKETLETETLRQTKLDFITELRCYNQVNKRIIQQELTAITKFLPNAEITGGDGSEKHLCWSWKGTNYNIKFEIRHGSDDNEYHGRKLRKVLNVLEAAYLWNWDHVKRQTYLSQRSRGTGLDKLMFVFGERPKL